ncbi:uncharacterized protein [Montipora foliosa]|uniref:uncharacterized protein n=1 Tax=Montipora foliosa TaxID=591990 RepID=UPI0035F20A9D
MTKTNSTSSLVNVATKSREIARAKQAGSSESFSRRSVVNDLLTRKSKENMSDTDILDDQEEDLRPEDTKHTHLMSLLAKMNKNMATMSDSLRELHDKRRHVVSADLGDHTAEPANKAAKTAENDPADLVSSAPASLAKSLDSQERTSDPVNKTLAEVANVYWLKKLGDDQYKETTGKYFRPENCKKVLVPKVNEEIWGKLSRNAKSRDVKFSRLQSNVTKAGCVVLNTAESLLNLSVKAHKSLAGELHNLLVQATDAIQVLGHASFEIAQLRREDIKSQINREYGDLCSANVPVTEWLFGDDLQTKLTHIRTANRVGSTASQAHGFHRRGNRAGSKAPANSTSSFLSRATPPSGRPNQPS